MTEYVHLLSNPKDMMYIQHWVSFLLTHTANDVMPKLYANACWPESRLRLKVKWKVREGNTPIPTKPNELQDVLSHTSLPCRTQVLPI